MKDNSEDSTSYYEVQGTMMHFPEGKMTAELVSFIRSWCSLMCKDECAMTCAYEFASAFAAQYKFLVIINDISIIYYDILF